MITTRWSGHREATLRIKENYHNILDCLRLATSSPGVDSADIAESTDMITENEYIFLNHVLNEVLELVDIGKKVLQSSGEQNLMSALAVINSVDKRIKELTSIYNDDNDIIKSVKTSMDVLLKNRKETETRKKSVPKNVIENFIVTERLPSASSSQNRETFRPLLVEVVDVLRSELDMRFNDKNHLFGNLWSHSCHLQVHSLILYL